MGSIPKEHMYREVKYSMHFVAFDKRAFDAATLISYLFVCL